MHNIYIIIDQYHLCNWLVKVNAQYSAENSQGKKGYQRAVVCYVIVRALPWYDTANEGRSKVEKFDVGREVETIETALIAILDCNSVTFNGMPKK